MFEFKRLFEFELTHMLFYKKTSISFVNAIEQFSKLYRLICLITI